MFSKLLGNDVIKQVLRRMIAARRVPGSLIFAGDAGVGKSRFAFELAKSVLCHYPQTGEACGKCASCHRIDRLELPKNLDREHNERVFLTQHPDVGYVRPAGRFITVETIRQLQSEAVLRPFENAEGSSGARFFIVDNADRMNDAAANALLKTLEEPAATTHLILLTPRPNSLLQTIRSRCQMLRFAPVPNGEIETFLTQHPVAEQKLSPNDVQLLARIARGSIGRALSLSLDDYKQQREMMFAVVGALGKNPDRARLLKIAEELNDAKLKDEYETRLEILQTLMHDLWALHLNAAPELIVNIDLQTKLSQIADQIDSRRARFWLAEIETLRENLSVNLNRKIATDALFMRLAAF